MRRVLVSPVGLLILTMFALAAPAQDRWHDPDPNVRRQAIVELRRSADPKAIARLDQLLADTDESLRAEAVDAIAELDTKEAVEPLARASKDSAARVRDRALEGMVSLYVVRGESGLWQRIADYFSKKSEDLVIDPGLEVDARVIAALVARLRDAEPGLCRKAARALGVLKARSAARDLAAVLSTSDAEFQIEALRALGKIRDPEVAGAISPLLQAGDDRVRMLAAETLAVSGAREQLPALKKMFESATSRDLRRKALEAISIIPDPSVTTLLARYLDDRDARLRELSADGLGRLARFGSAGAENAARLESRYGQERDRRVRLALAFGLLNYGRYNYLDDVIDSLGSRLYSSYGIAYLTELARQPGMPERYYPYLRSEKNRLRENLCEVFVRVGNPAAIDHLKPLMEDRNGDVAQAAIHAVTVLSRLAAPPAQR